MIVEETFGHLTVLITRRSLVQIQPPQLKIVEPRRRQPYGVYTFSTKSRKTKNVSQISLKHRKYIKSFIKML